MPDLSRRAFLSGASAAAAGLGIAGCVSTQPAGPVPRTTRPAAPPAGADVATSIPSHYVAIYGPVAGEPYPVPAVKLSSIDPVFLRQEVDYQAREAPGTIIVDPRRRFLYHIQGGNRAIRYGVGVGREGFGWSGAATVNSKQQWPDWYPPKEMIERQPEILRQVAQLQSGLGVPGGPRNPLGARALYLWQNGRDTLYRIHGTLEPWTIGRNVSSGCIRMINQDAIDLYDRTAIGTKVVVLA